MKDIKFGKMHTAFTGKIFSIVHQEVTYKNGKKDFFEFAQRPASVTIIAFNNKKEILLTREYRGQSKTPVWFLPAGQVDKKELPKSAAQRELREETGYRAKKMKMWKHAPFGSTKMMWDIFIFIAHDLVPAPLAQDEGESIEVVFTPFKKAVQMAIDGTIQDEYIAYHILRLDYLMKHKKFVL